MSKQTEKQADINTYLLILLTYTNLSNTIHKNKYKNLLTKSNKSNGRQYKQPQQHDPHGSDNH